MYDSFTCTCYRCPQILGSGVQWLEMTIRYDSNHSNTILHACSMHALFYISVHTCMSTQMCMLNSCHMHAACRELSEIHACYMKHASMLTLQHACLGDACRKHVIIWYMCYISSWEVTHVSFIFANIFSNRTVICLHQSTHILLAS